MLCLSKYRFVFAIILFKLAIGLWLIYALATAGEKTRAWAERVEHNTQVCAQGK